MIPIVGETSYAAKVLEVHSGDDIVLMVDLGVDGLYKRVRARLHRVDTPDAYKADSKSEAGRVRDKVRDMVSDRDCVVTVHAPRKTGWIVTLYISSKNPEDCVNLNEFLIVQGYVYKSGAVD